MPKLRKRQRTFSVSVDIEIEATDEGDAEDKVTGLLSSTSEIESYNVGEAIEIE